MFRLEDQSTGVKCLAWSEAYGKYRDFLKDDELLIVEGRIESSEGQEYTMILEECRRLSDAIPLKARNVRILLPESFDDEYLERIFALLSASRGNCDVLLDFCLEKKINLRLQTVPLKIQGTKAFAESLTREGCEVEWIL